MIAVIWLFLAGLFCANGIPHFVHGISGENFHNPSLHRFFRAVPSPLFNVIWGLLNFGLSLLLLSFTHIWSDQLGADEFIFGIGFIFAAVGLSIFFPRSK